MAFAGVGAGGRLSTMFWNPANLVDVPRFELEAAGTGLLGDSSVDLDPQPALGIPDSDQGNIGRNAVIPAGYAAYRPHDRIVLGIGVNAPFGLESRYDSGSILNRSGIAGTSRVRAVNVNPALSVAVTDWLSLGVGAQIQYFKARLTRQSLGALGISTLDGDDVALGFTAGIRLAPRPGTEIGLGYRSGLRHELDGSLQTDRAGTSAVHFDDLNLPAVTTLGIRQQVSERLRAMAGAEWTNWSSFGTVKVKDGPEPIDLPFQYSDGWYFSLGAEYDLTDQVTIRTGAGYELSPIDNSVRSFRLPYNDGITLSLGGTYRATEHLSLDLGYSYVALEDMKLHTADDGGPDANGPFSGRADIHAHFLSLALSAHW